MPVKFEFNSVCFSRYTILSWLIQEFIRRSIVSESLSVQYTMDSGPELTTTLTWANVALGFAFIVFDVIVSTVFGLGIGRSLLTAAVRCVIQLAVVALLLRKVFETDNPWAVAGITCEYDPLVAG